MIGWLDGWMVGGSEAWRLGKNKNKEQKSKAKSEKRKAKSKKQEANSK